MHLRSHHYLVEVAREAVVRAVVEREELQGREESYQVKQDHSQLRRVEMNRCQIKQVKFPN